MTATLLYTKQTCVSPATPPPRENVATISACSNQFSMHPSILLRATANHATDARTHGHFQEEPVVLLKHHEKHDGM